VTLKQYYHLCQNDVNAILKHWTQRQAADKVPFCFNKMDMAVGKNKHTLEEKDADTDMLSEEAEEDLQNNNGAS
jgi:hypothetical protein